MKALKLGMSQKNLSNKFVQASGEGSEKVESTEKMTEDEKDYVGVNIMEAIEENFEQHEEKIYLLAHGHTKGDLDEDDMEGEDSQDDGEGMEVEKEHSEKSSRGEAYGR